MLRKTIEYELAIENDIPNIIEHQLHDELLQPKLGRGSEPAMIRQWVANQAVPSGELRRCQR